MFSTRFKINSECAICNHSFDSDRHRPRALPCGHGFCTQCIQSCIDRGNTACSVCRTEHGANSATDLPVSFLLEESLQNASVSAPHMRVPNQAQAGAITMCPKHEEEILRFYCKSHSVEICHSCAFIHHHPTSCKLITIKKKLKEMKEMEIETVQKGKKQLIETENDLNRLNQEKDKILHKKKKKKQYLKKRVESLLTKIELMNQEITETNQSKEKIKNSIMICQMNRIAMETMGSEIHAASNQTFSQTMAKTTSDIVKIRRWNDEIRTELKINIKYAQLQRNGIIRSSKIFLEGDKVFILSLSEALSPGTSARLLKEAELGLTSANTKVFLELSAAGSSLGRFIINVQGNKPFGQHFIMLAIGSEGPTLTGASDTRKDFDSIQFHEYVTETGSRSDKPLISLPEYANNATASRGRVFRYGANEFKFIILTKYGAEYKEHFGDVIDGMDVVDRAYSSEFNIEDIHISNSGLILNY